MQVNVSPAHSWQLGHQVRKLPTEHALPKSSAEFWQVKTQAITLQRTKEEPVCWVSKETGKSGRILGPCLNCAPIKIRTLQQQANPLLSRACFSRMLLPSSLFAVCCIFERKSTESFLFSSFVSLKANTHRTQKRSRPQTGQAAVASAPRST